MIPVAGMELNTMNGGAVRRISTKEVESV